MNPNCHPEPPPRQKIPKDGVGPRGVPECYYTSRVLNSTARYESFIRKLRALEDEERIGLETATKIANDTNYLAFFTRCDRKALINKVAHRVDLCLASFEEDLEEKRKRLKRLLSDEEEHNVRLFVTQAQEGRELAWQDKMKRLAYLLQKRQKEVDDRIADIPLEKCSHVQSCLFKLRKKECQEVNLYQMREKQMRKESEREIDKMWHELAMRESDALAARMEHDAIERMRRDKEMYEYTSHQVDMLKQKRLREQEMLKQEALLLKADADAYYKQQEEEKRGLDEASKALGQEKREMIRVREEILAKQKEEEQLIEATWAAIAQTGMAADIAKEERRKRIERDLDECNFKLAELRKRIEASKECPNEMILQYGQQIRDAADLKRCQYKKWSKNCTIENQKYNRKVAEDIRNQEKELQKFEADGTEYERQVQKQLDALVKNKQLTDMQAKKLHRDDLLAQIEYNKILKKRAEEEELLERKKCKIAQKQYQEAIEEMTSRPYFSDKVHPFLSKMASGLQMQETCVCSPPTYCAEPSKSQANKKK